MHFKLDKELLLTLKTKKSSGRLYNVRTLVLGSKDLDQLLWGGKKKKKEQNRVTTSYE